MISSSQLCVYLIVTWTTVCLFQVSAFSIATTTPLVSKLSTLSVSTTTAICAHQQEEDDEDIPGETQNRRNVLATCLTLLTTTVLTTTPNVALAGIDPRALQALPVEGDTSGAATRLKQLSTPPAQDLEDVPYVKLDSGVSYREYREGKGEAVVQPGSKVAAEMTIRCQSFATNQEPGGVKYFSTKDDTDFNEVAWTLGTGQFSPALEEALLGMHKNGLRRIVLPSTAVFAARNNGQLPLPTTKDGQRRFESLFKTDATLLFEVLVTRIK